jgi:hypothetical protein
MKRWVHHPGRVFLIALLFAARALAACAAEPSIRLAGEVSVASRPGWQTASGSPRGGPVVLTRTGEDGAVLARITFTVETRQDHADAVRRLADVARESAAPPRWFALDGWPALERTQGQPLPQTGAALPPGEVGQAPDMTSWQMVTVAAAAGTLLVRAEAQLSPAAGPALREEAMQLSRSLPLPDGVDARQTARELEALRRPSPAPSSPAEPVRR